MGVRAVGDDAIVVVIDDCTAGGADVAVIRMLLLIGFVNGGFMNGGEGLRYPCGPWQLLSLSPKTNLPRFKPRFTAWAVSKREGAIVKKSVKVFQALGNFRPCWRLEEQY